MKGLLFSFLLIITVLMVLPHGVAEYQLFAKQTKADKAAEKKIEGILAKIVKDHYDQYCKIDYKLKKTNVTANAYDIACNVLPPPPPPPPPPGPGTVVVPPLNKSTTIRIGSTGDVDCNSAQTKEFGQLQTFQVQATTINGDFDYNDGKCVLNDLANHGYTKNNTALAVGNHDNCSDVIKFTGQAKCWYHLKAFGGKVEFFVMDSNDDYAKGSAQYNDIVTWLSQSTAMYKIVIIHEPFSTGKSNHGNNGQFSTYYSVFQQYGVFIVLQAHNHNYQRIPIPPMVFFVTGTGTHDQGSKLYDVTSNNDGQGHNLAAKLDDKNGVTLLDLNIANNTKAFKGYFVNLADNKVLDSFYYRLN